MPTIPAIKQVTGNFNNQGIINTIKQNDQTGYLDRIPYAENTIESIQMIGQEITSYAPARNSFSDALVNLIGMMRMSYMLFTNPWADLKKGKLEMGETIEQVWIGMAEMFPFNPEKSENRVLKRAKQDIRTAFHSINYRMVYKTTISTIELKQAFLSLDGLSRLIEEKIGSLGRTATNNEFAMMKYLFAQLLLDGKIKTMTIPAITASTADEVVTQIASITNLFQFPSANYNLAGVENTTPIDDLIIFESALANALLKVNSLANAFNVEYVKFLGQVKMFDSLGTYNWNIMDEILGDDPLYRRFTTDEIIQLDTVQLIACDRNFVQVYDAEYEMGDPFRNGEGKFTSYFLHHWEIFSASPFHNVVAYTTATPTVTSVTVTPATATASTGYSVGFQANVVTSGFGSSAIIWEISTASVKPGTAITQDGVLHIASDETAASITIKATSVADNTKSGSATVTIE